jgi:hypothetical protein
MTSMFENADTFLNANADLFNGLSESDLVFPERLVFLKGETVEGIILDTSIIEKIGAVKMEVKIETGDHTGKLFELTQFKPKDKDGKISPTQKKQWIEFLLAFFTKEEILGGKVDFNKFIGSKLQFKALEAREVNGKTYQNYVNFKLVESAPF